MKPLTVFTALALAAPAFAQPAAPTPPRLIVAIAIDQLSADLYAQYRPHFTGGLKRLGEGAVFASGYQAHAATETCPGHSTILTGAWPARSGIIANAWFDPDSPRPDKKIYCAEDTRVPGSTSENYTASARHLRVPTLGERLKAANPASRSVSVAGKDRAALMMGGQRIDQAWWWDGKAYAGATGQRAHPAAIAFAESLTAQLARPQPALAAPPLCAARARAIPIGGGKTVGSGRFGREAGDLRGFRASPESDGATLALAASLIDAMALGRRAAPDIVSIGLSATDYVGHTFGTQGQEMCLQMLALDRDLGDFFARLDRAGIDYAVALTADHGGLDLPERTREQGSLAAQRVDPALEPDAVGARVGAKLGIAGPVLYGDGPFGDVWLAAGIPAAQRRRAIDEAIAIYRGFPQVFAVFERARIAATPLPNGPPDSWTPIERVRAAHHPHVSGEFVVILKPRVTPIADPLARGYVATHGSAWDYDRRVPILFWRKGMTPFEQPLAIDTVDIMPTLAALLGLAVPPGEVDGRCRDLDSGAGSTCH